MTTVKLRTITEIIFIVDVCCFLFLTFTSFSFFLLFFFANKFHPFSAIIILNPTLESLLSQSYGICCRMFCIVLCLLFFFCWFVGSVSSTEIYCIYNAYTYNIWTVCMCMCQRYRSVFPFYSKMLYQYLNSFEMAGRIHVYMYNVCILYIQFSYYIIYGAFMVKFSLYFGNFNFRRRLKFLSIETNAPKSKQ